MKFNELIVADCAELNAEQKEFLVLHNRIISNGNAAAVCFIETARGLKEMRDGGKYKSAGFETFGEYSESACGIKERQAYSYISVVENLSNEFLQTSAKIGVSKLAVLASMSLKEREELVAEHGVELESISTKELDKLKKEYETREKQLKFDFETQLKAKEEEIEELQDAIDEIGAVDYISDIKRAEDEKAALERELEAIRNAPPKADEKSKLELEKKKEEIKKLKAAKEAAEKEFAEAKAKSEKEVAEAIEKERAVVKAMEKELELKRAQIEADAKKAKIAADPVMSEFKAKFTMWQEIGNGLCGQVLGMENENADKCKRALNAAINAILEVLK